MHQVTALMYHYVRCPISINFPPTPVYSPGLFPKSRPLVMSEFVSFGKRNEDGKQRFEIWGTGRFGNML